MTDRSTDHPEDQPVPHDPDETAAADSGVAEQEAMVQADAAGVDGQAEPNELAELVEPDEPDDADEVEDDADLGDAEAGGEEASDLDAAELEAAASAAEEDPRLDTRVVEVDAGSPAAPSGPATRGAPKATAATRAGGRTAIVVDPALRIRDRASQVFVVLTVVVFVAIFANAMLFGVGGAVTTTPAPTPIATPASSSSPSPSAS
ncbi:MAG TPA: hypothetical protein VEX41_02920 [Candidatus Eisenbacteria bacterium]|nr:hypothetical protein [Candidatus Eisenbacteria bacterium]